MFIGQLKLTISLENLQNEVVLCVATSRGREREIEKKDRCLCVCVCVVCSWCACLRQLCCVCLLKHKMDLGFIANWKFWILVNRICIASFLLFVFIVVQYHCFVCI